MNKKEIKRTKVTSDSVFTRTEGGTSPLLALLIWGIVIYLMIHVGESIGRLWDLFL